MRRCYEFIVPGMTSTPINDITMTLKEGRTAILFLENNLNIVDENPEEERIYSTSDFQAALKADGKIGAQGSIPKLIQTIFRLQVQIAAFQVQ